MARRVLTLFASRLIGFTSGRQFIHRAGLRLAERGLAGFLLCARAKVAQQLLITLRLAQKRAARLNQPVNGFPG